MPVSLSVMVVWELKLHEAYFIHAAFFIYLIENSKNSNFH